MICAITPFEAYQITNDLLDSVVIEDRIDAEKNQIDSETAERLGDRELARRLRRKAIRLRSDAIAYENIAAALRDGSLAFGWPGSRPNGPRDFRAAMLRLFRRYRREPYQTLSAMIREQTMVLRHNP
jgi:hypothetical protein